MLPYFQTIRFAFLLLILASPLSVNANSAPTLENDITNPRVETLIKEIFTSANKIESKTTDTHVWPVYSAFQLIGYAFESKDFIQIPGFAGDIINLLIGMDTEGKIIGVRVLFQHEPIFMHGLGVGALENFLAQYSGHSVAERIIVDSSRSRSQSSVGGGSVIFDGVTKATVSVIATNDTLLAASLEVARKVLGKFTQSVAAQVRSEIFEPLNWQQLLDKQLIAHWPITRQTLQQALDRPLSDYPGYGFESADKATLVSDIYYAYLNAPSIGKNLLGDKDYQRLMDSLKQNEHVIAVMSEGPYNYLEDDFRAGKIPTRMGIFQNGLPMLIRDLAFYRFYDKEQPESIKRFDNFRLFGIKANGGFDPSLAIDFQLGFDLRQNHLLGDNISLSTSHQLPDYLFFHPEVIKNEYIPIWKRIWASKTLEISLTLISLALLSLLFIKQRYFSKYPKLIKYGRFGFMLFTLFFIGYYAQGQLSIVNIYTVLLSLRDGFKFDIFLLDPILFILWTYTFISLFIWGRGLFCGWLCPFGALQELLYRFAKMIKLPQIRIKDASHLKLQKIKYIILLGLLAICFYDLGWAQTLAEVEPFKTSITLVFDREWYFVLYTVLLLALGMVIHKFYCRYMCPLGAGLAILGYFHLFEQLDRRSDCGKPCQVCAVRCEIKAIKKSGKVDYNECIQCLECEVIYYDEHQCAPIMLANKRGKRQPINSSL